MTDMDQPKDFGEMAAFSMQALGEVLDEQNPKPAVKEVRIDDAPMKLTPYQIRGTFGVPMEKLILGIQYTQERGWRPATTPIEPGKGVLLTTELPPYENEVLMRTILRELLSTHRDQVTVFGWGWAKYAFENLAQDPNFYPASHEDNDLGMLFAAINREAQTGKIPVLFMDMLNLTEKNSRAKPDPGGSLTVPLNVLKYIGSGEIPDVTKQFDSFLHDMHDRIFVVGSLGFNASRSPSSTLARYFPLRLLQTKDDPYRSPRNLAYVRGGVLIQAATNS